MKKIIYLFAGFTLLTTGCDKKLDLANPNLLTTADYLEDKGTGICRLYRYLQCFNS
jgi:hypothetical protein